MLPEEGPVTKVVEQDGNVQQVDSFALEVGHCVYEMVLLYSRDVWVVCFKGKRETLSFQPLSDGFV